MQFKLISLGIIARNITLSTEERYTKIIRAMDFADSVQNPWLQARQKRLLITYITRNAFKMHCFIRKSTWIKTMEKKTRITINTTKLSFYSFFILRNSIDNF
ncbi:MAG TPA: hypothetical protein VK177_20070 [Flavobacteriales bacterium]|nr:hypothetical protein [Flavobacteriales bacterium]